MTSRSRGQVAIGFLCLFLALSLSGVNYCQRSYSFMEQVRVAATATPTEEPTATPDEDATETPEPTETPEDEPTEQATPVDTIEAAGAGLDPLFSKSAAMQSLEELSKLTPAPVAAPSPVSKAVKGSQSGGGNWLGQIHRGDERGEFLDPDGDGYADWLEGREASDPSDPASIPSLPTSTSLADRLKPSDHDLDGLSDAEESRIGTNPAVSDSDRDGVSDGSEVLSASGPLDAASRPEDADRDGLSNRFENQAGSSPYRADSDLDGLSDGVEMAIGSDPLNPDTDGDGVSDGREFSLGSDPSEADF